MMQLEIGYYADYAPAHDKCSAKRNYVTSYLYNCLEM